MVDNNIKLGNEASELNRYIDAKHKELLQKTKDNESRKRKKRVFVTNYVHDLISLNTKYVIIIENPGKKEIKKQIPLIGGAGRRVYRNFIEKKYFKSMGVYLNENKDGLYSIMCLSNIPLTRKESNKKEIYANKNILNCFKEIRPCNKPFGELTNSSNEVEYVLYTDFKQRLEDFRSNNAFKKVTYIVCGELAKRYIEKFNNELVDNKIPKKRLIFISHPSVSSVDSYYEYSDSVKPYKEPKVKGQKKVKKEKKKKLTKEEKKQFKKTKKEAKIAERKALDESNNRIIERERLEKEQRKEARRAKHDEKKANKGVKKEKLPKEPKKKKEKKKK